MSAALWQNIRDTANRRRHRRRQHNLEKYMQLKRVAEAKPAKSHWRTLRWWDFEELATGHDHAALVLAILRVKRRSWLAFIPNARSRTRF